MSHTAFRFRLVKEKLYWNTSTPVCSLCLVDDKWLLAGTEDGCLLLFDVTSGKLNALNVKKPEHGKYPITQLIPLPGVQILLALTDHGCVRQYALRQDLAIKKDVPGVQGCSVMAAKRERGKYHIAVGKKHKLYILGYQGEETGFTVQSEFAIPDLPKSLAWNTDGILVIQKTREKEYWLSLTTGKIKELSTATCQVPLPVSQEILSVCPYIHSTTPACVTRGPNAEATRDTSMNWKEKGIHTLCAMYPYIFAMSPSGIEVRMLPTEGKRSEGKRGDLPCQVISVDHPKLSSLSNIVDMDWASEQRNAMRGDELHSEGAKLKTPQQQIYITNSNNDVYVLESIPFSQQIDELISREEYDHALTLGRLLTPSDVSDELVQRVSILHGFYLFTNMQWNLSMHQFLEADIDPRIVIKIFGLLPAYVSASWEPPKEYLGHIKKASEALAQVQHRFKAAHQLKQWLKNFRKPGQYKQGEDLVKPDTSDAGMKIASIDTALLGCYLMTSEEDVVNFLEQPNRCVLDDCQLALQKEGKWTEIVALYHSKGLNRRALELLKDLGLGIKKGSIMGGADDLKKIGLEETIRYIQRLNGQDPLLKELALEYSKWVLTAAEPAVCLQMFYHKKGKIVPPKDVLRHFNDVLGEHATELQKRYLEAILNDKMFSGLPEVKTTDVHDALIRVYVDQITKLDNEGQDEQRAVISGKLQTFMKSSEKYNAERMKQLLEAPVFYREAAIARARLDEHRDALVILAHKLGSFAEAEAYCNEESRPPPPLGEPVSREDKGRLDMYYTLFELYLQPPHGKPTEQNISDALKLLQRHPDKIDCLKALKMLPADTGVSKLQDWLVQVLKDVSCKLHELRVYRNLCKSENQQAAVARIKGQQSRVIVDSESTCAVCKTKIGSRSILAVYPNKVMVHKGCATRDGGSLQVCPVTKKRFSPLDAFENPVHQGY
eukprot:TRINITY_DN14025_c0_g1_i1.p1 TRINITY_DN14025_c0_g1~~TRINITY_DN14025_c0_g1_i1.p1  ORF type:complete len:947 (+),score=159.96 TRINITY_DN14025_c0_g1_i1:95-2935(+)